MYGSGVTLLIIIGLFMFVVIGGIAMISCHYTLDGIKSKTVGDGQHGTARFASKQEIRKTFTHVEYLPKVWVRQHIFFTRILNMPVHPGCHF